MRLVVPKRTLRDAYNAFVAKGSGEAARPFPANLGGLKRNVANPLQAPALVAISLPRQTECSAAWLAYLVRNEGVVGSNPTTPTNRKLWFRGYPHSLKSTKFSTYTAAVLMRLD